MPRRAAVKSEERSLQKVTRDYAGDSSRLTDLVRATLVFENLPSLSRCVHHIATFPGVRIHRLKNRFSTSYDASTSAGYRDLCLVISLETDATCSLGVQNHLCEIQLALKSIFAVKSTDGHQRYIQWRNLIGN